MALIHCVECGKNISDSAAQCIHCGCPYTTSRNFQSNETNVASHPQAMR